MIGEEGKLYIRLFGHFEVMYEGRILFLGRNKASKSIRLLQLLVTYKDTGISRNRLLDYLFMDEEVADLSNSLRVNLYRMRKLLTNAGVPKDELCILEDGTYRWNSDIPLETDLEQFQNYLLQADEKDDDKVKSDLLFDACCLYQGEFLEEIGAEEWVVVQSVQYKQRFERAMKQLFELCRKHNDYKRMLQVSCNACKIYPYDEWQVEQIESLISLNRGKEALNIYNQTVHMYLDELEIKVPLRMVEQIRRLNPDVQNNQDLVRDIQQRLEEPVREGGAIYLSLPSFTDTFRLMVRIAERSSQALCLMACTIKENSDTPLSDPDKIQATAEALREAIKESLRRGDSYTRYSDTQFIILLVGTEEDKCEMIFRRIYSRFRKKRRSWQGSLRYYITSVDNMNGDAAKINLRNNKFHIDKDI